MYTSNCRHMRKYEPRDKVRPAIDLPEVTEERPITMDKEGSISPENLQGEGKLQPENGDKKLTAV